MESKVMDFIVRLETRTRQLILQYNALQEKYNELQAKLGERENQILSLQNDKKELMQQYEQLKLAKYIDIADDDTRKMRKRLNRMVNDIDECIALLKVEEA